MAPLSGYTDLPFRNACRRYGCHYAFTPLIDAGSVVHRNPRNLALLARGDHERWLGVQLLGNDPEILREAAQQLQERNFDLFDLNLGCPVPKVTRRGAGAALAEDLHKAQACVASLLEVCRQPVTAKIRILDPIDPEPTVQLALALQECGIAVLTIHGRHRDRLYSGPVATGIIRCVRDNLSVRVVANGGVTDKTSAATLKDETGCSRIMVARGAIGNPWIFRELSNPAAATPTHEELCDEMERHILEMVDFYGEFLGMRNARKIILAYLVGRSYRRCRRAAVTSIGTVAEFQELLHILRDEGPVPTHPRG